MNANSQDRLRAIVEANVKDKQLFSEFMHSHSSVAQKLYSLEYFAAEVAGLQPVETWERIVRDDGQSVKSSTNVVTYGFQANMYLDCLLMNAMASLDTLAHEIGVIYVLQTVPLGDKSRRRGDLYISTIGDKLKKCHTKSRLVEYLGDELTKEWFGTLDMYRNCTTHESLVAPKVVQTTSLITDEIERSVPLPDDPRVWPSTHTKNREMRSYSETVRQDVNRVVAQSYECVIKDLSAANNTIPMPSVIKS